MPIDPLIVIDSSPCMLRLSSLASLTSVHSDHLPSCSLWHWRWSLAVALSSPSRRNLSCALRFINVELHGEESFVTQNIKKFQHVCKSEMQVYLHFRPFNLHHVRRQTYTHILQCSPTSVGLAASVGLTASVGLAQVRPN